MSEILCAVCKQPIGHGLSECPQGAQPLPYRRWIERFDGGVRGGSAYPPVPRENLRLRVDDQDPEQPDLFEELT